MTGNKDVLGPWGTARWMEMRWLWDENGGLVQRKLLHRHISNHCLCLSLPAASAGLALHSCVHLPSSSRASSKRYWSLSFLRFWFPGLLCKQVPGNGEPGPQHIERNAINWSSREPEGKMRHGSEGQKGIKGTLLRVGGLEKTVWEEICE